MQYFPEYLPFSTVFNIPAVLLIGIAVIASILAFAAERIYRADVKLYYGEEMRKLKALIADMQALKS